MCVANRLCLIGHGLTFSLIVRKETFLVMTDTGMEFRRLSILSKENGVGLAGMAEKNFAVLIWGGADRGTTS